MSKLYRKYEQHKAYLETSVGVVVGVAKLCCHQKCCGGMGCAVVSKPAAKYIKVTCSSVWLCCIGSLLPDSCIIIQRSI